LSTSKLSVYQNAIKNEDSKALLERLYAANPTAGSFYDLDVAAADAAHTSGKEQLDTNLATSKAALEKNKTAQKRAASYSYAKLLNYLPEQLKAQGLHGQGLSQSALLGAYGNYRNAVAGVDADYADRVSALEKAYKTDLAGLDATRDSAYHTALQNYMTRVDNTESRSALNEKIMEELEVKFAEAETTGDYGAAAQRLEELKDSVDEITYNYFASILPEAYKPTAAETTQGESAEGQGVAEGSQAPTSQPTPQKSVQDFVAEQNASKPAYDRLQLKNNGKTFDANAETTYETAWQISKGLGIYVDEEQAKAVQAVLSESASWGPEQNGTLVSFNVGGKLRGAKVFVFYNGKWYETNASSATDAKEYLKN